MKDPYYVALFRAAISAVILSGGTTAALLATDASTRSILAAFLVSFFGVLGTRFLGEGTIDSHNKSQREADLIIQDAAREGFIARPAGWGEVIGGRPAPVDFDEDYHFGGKGDVDRHRGRLASDCPICLREQI